MRLEDLVQVLELEELTIGDPSNTDADITRGYASDLLSDVLANAPTGGILVTLQVHLNVIAVASHAGDHGCASTAVADTGCPVAATCGRPAGGNPACQVIIQSTICPGNCIASPKAGLRPSTRRQMADGPAGQLCCG